MTVLPAPRRTTKSLAAVSKRTKKEFACSALSDEPTPDPSQEGNCVRATFPVSFPSLGGSINGLFASFVAGSETEGVNAKLETSFSAVTISVRVAPVANDRSNQPGL